MQGEYDESSHGEGNNNGKIKSKLKNCMKMENVCIQHTIAIIAIIIIPLIYAFVILSL